MSSQNLLESNSLYRDSHRKPVKTARLVPGEVGAGLFLEDLRVVGRRALVEVVAA